MNPILVNLLTFIFSPSLVMQFTLFILTQRNWNKFIHMVGAGKAKDKRNDVIVELVFKESPLLLTKASG
jgi:hypothetical protein